MRAEFKLSVPGDAAVTITIASTPKELRRVFEQINELEKATGHYHIGWPLQGLLEAFREAIRAAEGAIGVEVTPAKS